MAIELPELPYRTDELSPFLSKETMETHHGKHHRGYVNKLNGLISGTVHADRSLTDIVVHSHANSETGIFNNAAQCFNHGFLWDSMSPHGGGAPAGALHGALESAFGDLDGFKEAFKTAAMNQFGSGWVWLVSDTAGLSIISTGNADTPIVSAARPLLTLDVWEHAYYLDYKNERARYVDTFLSDHINWSFAEENYASDPAKGV